LPPQISERNVGHAVLLAVGPSASLSFLFLLLLFLSLPDLSAVWSSEHLYLVFYDMSRTPMFLGGG